LSNCFECVHIKLISEDVRECDKSGVLFDLTDPEDMDLAKKGLCPEFKPKPLFTKTIPTEPGYYWLKNKCEPEIVFIGPARSKAAKDQWYMWEIGENDDTLLSVAAKAGALFGPRIEPPKVEKRVHPIKCPGCGADEYTPCGFGGVMITCRECAKKFTTVGDENMGSVKK